MLRTFKKMTRQRLAAHRSRPLALLALAAVCLVLSGGPPAHAKALPSDSELLELSLEDLMTLEVTSATPVTTTTTGG